MKELKYPELAAEMVRNGETQRILAKKLGMTYQAIWRRLSGRVEFTIDEIEAICEHYGKTFEELFKRNKAQ